MSASTSRRPRGSELRIECSTQRKIIPFRRILALDAPLSSADYSRTAEGKGRVKQILQINDTPEETIKDFTDIQELLPGMRVRIEVRHKIVSGLLVPRVQAILGKVAPSADDKAP